ncbi:hypothetical protein [Rubrolithibacter danxiaensis]|uniref:hypothetical protein n=1 Tax=Rubrolithibacter danxiaensis TaxID=3390805 RepID=UPI003BF77C31
MSLKVNILSPHIDDAAYGLTLHISSFIKSEVPLTLINCFTVTRWTAIPVESKEVKDVMLLRETEDNQFNSFFNSAIKIINLNLLDAPLRNGYIFQTMPFEAIEWEMVEKLKNYLEENITGILLCPLGIGNHIDHAICREAVEQIYRKIKVVFYEDLPYAARISQEAIFDHVKELETKLNIQLGSHIHSVQNCSIDKELAVRIYKSQMNDTICSEIISHMNSLSGERLWGEQEVLESLVKVLRC